MTDEQVMHAMGIDDAYRVERVLAKNATGVTELVTIEGAGPFARKKIAAKYARRAVWASLLDCASLRLPQVVVTYELPDSFVVVYDYVPGATIKESIGSAGPMEPSEAVAVARDICEAAQVLHEHGIIHRDISPGNIVIAADGAHLIDLGIARMRNESATHDTTSLGTYGFASPEQYGFAQTDARSDVYSIGCLLGYLLTGLSSDKDGYDAALDTLEQKHPGICGVIKKACAFEPSARYQSAHELAEALSEQNAEQKPERKAPSWEPVEEGGAKKSSRSSKLPFIVAGVVLVVLAVILAVFFVVRLQTGGNAARENESVTATSPVGSASANGADGTSEESEEASGSAAETAKKNGSANTGASATGTAAAADIADSLEVESIGCSRDEWGYIRYGLTLRSNDANIYEFPVLEVTAKDEAGNILFVDTQSPTVVGAGQTIACTGIESTDTVPASIECKVTSDLATSVVKGQTLAAFDVDDINASVDSGVLRVTGNVTLVSNGTYQSTMDFVCVAVILKDEQGAIIGGDTTGVARPSEGSPAPFDISVSSASNYASYEIYAYEA